MIKGIKTPTGFSFNIDKNHLSINLESGIITWASEGRESPRLTYVLGHDFLVLANSNESSTFASFKESPEATDVCLVTHNDQKVVYFHILQKGGSVTATEHTANIVNLRLAKVFPSGLSYWAATQTNGGLITYLSYGVRGYEIKRSLEVLWIAKAHDHVIVVPCGSIKNVFWFRSMCNNEDSVNPTLPFVDCNNEEEITHVVESNGDDVTELAIHTVSKIYYIKLAPCVSTHF